MTIINNINEFANSAISKAAAYKANTIEESFAKYQKHMNEIAEKQAQKLAKKSKKLKAAYKEFTMDSLKANRNEIINTILGDCNKENLAVVMNKMVSMINEGFRFHKSIRSFVSAAEDQLREEGGEVIN